MGRLISIDPGVGLGWAVFVDRELIEAGICDGGTIRGSATVLRAVFDRIKPTDVAIEIPQVYQPRYWRGDPNDLIGVAVLAGVAAAMATPYTEPVLVHPHTWKGSRPKDVDNEHTIGLLSVAELGVLRSCGATKGRLHNVIDAVGLGLWALQRR